MGWSTPAPAQPALTCITCGIKFTDPELHREHFKSDWHRYNLKRKVALLPSITLQEFEDRKDAHERQVAVTAAAAVQENYCIACGKNFKSRKAYLNHLDSKKHKEMILKFEAKPPKNETLKEDVEMEEEQDDEDLEIEEVDSDEWEEDGDPIPPTDCLFCGHHSKNIENNLRHMAEKHSFFVPDLEYCTDVEGLLEYLGCKVGQGLMCLWCNTRSKLFTSVAAVQRHMRDTGHCKLLLEGDALLEYSEWYDYSTSYPQDEDSDENDTVDSEVDVNVLDDSNYQLTLPSGTKVGHRSLVRYYRQSLNPERALIPKDRSASGRFLCTYRALGWTGSSGKDALIKAKDLGHMKRLENYHRMKVGVKANKLRGNTHFKDRNGMC